MNLLPQSWHEYGFSPVCKRIWIFSSVLRRKLFPHSVQANCFSPECILMWILWSQRRTKLFPHSVHENGFSPVCVRICSLRLLLRRNRFPQTVQLKGLSSMCDLSCNVRVLRRPKLLPQTWQQNGFSPVCVLIWRVKVLLWPKLSPHWVHEKGFSPVCVLMCKVRLPLCRNVLPHIEQQKGFSPVCVRRCFNRPLFWAKTLPHSLHTNRSFSWIIGKASIMSSSSITPNPSSGGRSINSSFFTTSSFTTYSSTFSFFFAPLRFFGDVRTGADEFLRLLIPPFFSGVPFACAALCLFALDFFSSPFLAQSLPHTCEQQTWCIPSLLSATWAEGSSELHLASLCDLPYFGPLLASEDPASHFSCRSKACARKFLSGNLKQKNKNTNLFQKHYSFVLPFTKYALRYCNAIPVVQMALHCNITVLQHKCTQSLASL